MDNKKQKNKFTKERIIKLAAELASKDINTMKDCYNAVESVVKEIISSTDKNNPTSIKMCDGISIDCEYIPEKQKKNNLNGDIIVVAGHIKPKFNITRSFVQSINSSK